MNFIKNRNYSARNQSLSNSFTIFVSKEIVKNKKNEKVYFICNNIDMFVLLWYVY